MIYQPLINHAHTHDLRLNTLVHDEENQLEQTSENISEEIVVRAIWNQRCQRTKELAKTGFKWIFPFCRDFTAEESDVFHDRLLEEGENETRPSDFKTVLFYTQGTWCYLFCEIVDSSFNVGTILRIVAVTSLVPAIFSEPKRTGCLFVANTLAYFTLIGVGQYYSNPTIKSLFFRSIGIICLPLSAMAVEECAMKNGKASTASMIGTVALITSIYCMVIFSQMDPQKNHISEDTFTAISLSSIPFLLGASYLGMQLGKTIPR